MKLETHYKSSCRLAIYSGLIIFSLFLTSSVHAQTLTLQSPNGGELWNYGGTEIASWTGNNLSSVVTVEFSYDGGTNWWYFGEAPSGPGGGSASVSVPNTSTENAILRITDVSNPAATDVSDGPFTVFVAPIVIWNPEEGQVYYNNSNAYVIWDLNVFDINLLNAELSTDNGQTFEPMAENIIAYSLGKYLNFAAEPSDSCILKLYNTADPTEFGLSGLFKIIQPPVYTITSPSAGELVNAYKPFTITWTVENVYTPNCFLQYSTNNGITWENIDNAVTIGNSGSYEWITPNVNSEQCLVRIIDSFESSVSDTSEVFSIFPFPETPICMVSVDSLTNYNVIIWEKPVTDIIDDFLVYKETDETNVYEVIDTVSYESTPIVTDFGSNPAIQPYRYKLGFIDTQNRLFPASDYHQTIHLTINQGINGAWNLIWTSYIGFDYSSYKILRQSASGIYEQIASVSASFNSYTDFNAPAGVVSYMIKVEHPTGCNPALSMDDFSSIFSNVAPTGSTVSINENYETEFNIFPTPADEQINIKFGENISGITRIILSDLTGRAYLSVAFDGIRQDQVRVINTTGLKEGMYLLTLINDKGKNTRKVVIRH